MNFEEKFNEYCCVINKRLEEVFIFEDCPQKEVFDAMKYSIKAGGKRIRPVLTLATAHMLGGNVEAALRFGVAIECIHTYSLIHDDLPCMDNDDMRRGIPTCHKRFGESTALLAGDGLLNFAFEYMSAADEISPAQTLRIISEISKCSGTWGMIGGQIVDLANEGRTDVREELLTYMHSLKTGALIRAAVISGGLCSDADENELQALTRFADCLGLAFQIQDDILDCIGDSQVLGKPVGSDQQNDKTTYVTLLGIDGAKRKAEALTQAALDSLDMFNEAGEFLRSLALWLMGREK